MPEPVDVAARRLAAIVEWSDDAIVSKDLNGTIATWNRAAERMFGYTAAEAIGQSITIIVPHDRLAEEDEVLRTIRSGRALENFETLRRHKDGTLIPIALTVSPIRDIDGRVIGASKIARDISDRRKAERALAEAEARQRDLQKRLITLVAASRTLFGSLKQGDMLPKILELAGGLLPADAYAVWRLDTDSGTWRVGAAHGVSSAFAQRIIDSYNGEAVGMLRFDDPLVVEDAQAAPLLDERRDAYRAEGIESLLAVPLQIHGAASGSLVFYYRTKHAFGDVEVHIGRALGNLSAAAITTAELYEAQRRSRAHAERANRQAEFLVQVGTALASSLDYESTLRTVARLAVPAIADWCVVHIVDDDSEIKPVALAHVDPRKLELARTLQERYPENRESPYGVRAVIRTASPVMMSEIPSELIEQLASDPEHVRLIRELAIESYICVPLVGRGRAFGAITFVTAESGRRYTAEDMRFAQDVAYRAALAVENARVYAQANAANRAKDEFLATLSHELRTPLNAVLGWVRMLRSGSVAPAKQARALEVIEHNANAQVRLVEDLLDLSRIITGKFRLDPQPVHIAGSIDAAVAAIQPAAAAKNISVTVDAEAGVGLISGDAQRLQQAVWNLLANAIKFTPPGGFVSVTLCAVGTQVIVEVTDTGEGIAPGVLPFVFDRFRQGDSGSTRSHMGLGLGLAIVRHIVELHGGRVDVSSEGVGKGASFRLSLPALEAGPASRRSRRRRPTVESSLEARALTGVRILIVDDDQEALEFLGEILRHNGLDVRAAVSVSDALAAIDDDPPEVIVTDIAMPGEDGYDLMRAVRARTNGVGASLPMLALSAYAREEDQARSLAMGFAAHLAKPVDLTELLGAIAEATGRTERSNR